MKRLVRRNKGGCLVTIIIITLILFLSVRGYIRENRKSQYFQAETSIPEVEPLPTPTIKLLPVPLEPDEKIYGIVTLPEGQILRSTPWFHRDNIIRTIPYGAVVEILGESEDGKWAYVSWLNEDEIEIDEDGDRSDYVESWNGFMYYEHLKLESFQ